MHDEVKKNKDFSYLKADVSIATWTLLQCTMPQTFLGESWSPKNLLQCTNERGLKSIAILGGSTSSFIMTDLTGWVESGTGKLSSEQVDVHTKERGSQFQDQTKTNKAGLFLETIFRKIFDQFVNRDFFQN